MTDKTGGPAYPQFMVTGPDGKLTSGWDGWGVGGMTLRDYFAAAALTGLLVHDGGQVPQYGFEQAAETAFTYASAMLAEREKQGDGK